MQIPLITCPRCLARIINPNAGRELSAEEAQSIFRRQVMPLEDEAEGDIWGTTRLLGILAAALMGGGMLLGTKRGIDSLSLILTVAGLAIAGLIWVLRRKTPKADVPAPLYLRSAE